MSNLSEVAQYLTAGGLPRNKPHLDYYLFLPYLVQLHYHNNNDNPTTDDGSLPLSLTEFDTKGELNLLKEFIKLELKEVKTRAHLINQRRIDTNKSSISLCSKYSEADSLTKASLIYHLYLSSHHGYGPHTPEVKTTEIKDSLNLLLANSQGTLEFKYIIQSFLFQEEEGEGTLKHLVEFLLMGHVSMDIALSFSASCLFFLEQFLEILHQAYRARPSQKSYISGWLVSILSNFPHVTDVVAFHLSSWKIAPNVIRSVSFDNLDLQISFLNGLINSHTLGIPGIKHIDEPISGNHPSLTQSLVAIIDCPDWLKDRAVQAASMTQYFLKLLERFIKEPTHTFSSLCSFLRVVASFKLIYNVKFSLPIFHQVLTVLTTYLQKLQVPTRFFDLCLCFVTIAGIDYNTEGEAHLANFLEILFNHHFMAILHLVTAVRCNNLDAVSSYLSLLLGFRFKLERQCLPKMRGLFTSRIFDDETLINRMFSISSIDYDTLKSTMPERVATRHISYLLGCGIKAIQDKSYSKYKLDLPTWVCSLMINLRTLPIHSYLPILVKEYVQCISNKKADEVAKIPENLLVKYLHPKAKDWSLTVGPREVVLLYYILLHNEKLAELSTTSPDVVPPLKYSDGLFDSIPVKRIVAYVEGQDMGPDLAEFKAEFCGLARSTFAHFFGVSTTVFVNKRDGEILTTPLTKYPTLKMLQSYPALAEADSLDELLSLAIEDSHRDSTKLQHVLEYLKFQPSNLLLKLTPTLIKRGLPLILNTDQGPTILDPFLELWNLLNDLTPEKLWLLTVNNAQNPSTKMTNLRLRECTIQDLYEDPLVLARIHPRFFKIPQLFQIFITMLDSVRGASCSRFQRILRYRNHKQKTVFSLDATRNMLCLQDTLIIQMVLEMCQDSYQSANQENIATIRHIAFNFIHLQFVETPAYIQVVHFQTYPLDLIPLTVEHIPSLYVAMNEVPALLHHTSPATQWFGLVLASHLLQKYPLQSSFLLVEDPIFHYLRRILGRLTITLTHPSDPHHWSTELTRLTGDLDPTTLQRELEILRWVQLNLKTKQVEEVMVRVAGTSKSLAKKLQGYIEPLVTPWDTHQLRQKLASLCHSHPKP